MLNNQKKPNSLKNAIESLRFGEHICNLNIVFYTDCVNLINEELKEVFEYYKYTPGFNAVFCIPNDVYFELDFMKKYSKISKFKTNASLILDNCKKQSWNLEDFYEAYTDRAPYVSHKCLFVFSAFSMKQQEFVCNAHSGTGHLVSCFSNSKTGNSFVCNTFLIDKAKDDMRRHTPDVHAITHKTATKEKINTVIFERNNSSTLSIPFLETQFLPTYKSGTESVLYECRDSNLNSKYIKLYRRNYIATDSRLQKLKFLQRFGQYWPEIDAAFPEDIAYADEITPEAIGISIKKATGETLNTLVFSVPVNCTYQLKREVFDDYVRKIFSVLLDLHCFQIFVSDLSDNNIIINHKTGELCFVDCDSFQTINIPGGGFTPEFKHRDIKEEELNYTLRYPLHEDFALAILLYKMYAWAEVFIGPDMDYRVNWEKDSFQFDISDNCDDLDCSQDIKNAWINLDMQLKTLFADELHFRKSFGIGSWIEALGFDK